MFCRLKQRKRKLAGAPNDQMFPNTVKTPCATTSHKRPPIQKHQNFPSKSLTVVASSKQTPPVSNCDHFLGLTVNDFPLFLTSCRRLLDAVSDLYVRCVHYAT